MGKNESGSSIPRGRGGDIEEEHHTPPSTTLNPSPAHDNKFVMEVLQFQVFTGMILYGCLIRLIAVKSENKKETLLRTQNFFFFISSCALLVVSFTHAMLLKIQFDQPNVRTLSFKTELIRIILNSVRWFCMILGIFSLGWVLFVPRNLNMYGYAMIGIIFVTMVGRFYENFVALLWVMHDIKKHGSRSSIHYDQLHQHVPPPLEPFDNFILYKYAMYGGGIFNFCQILFVEAMFKDKKHNAFETHGFLMNTSVVALHVALFTCWILVHMNLYSQRSVRGIVYTTLNIAFCFSVIVAPILLMVVASVNVGNINDCVGYLIVGVIFASVVAFYFNIKSMEDYQVNQEGQSNNHV